MDTTTFIIIIVLVSVIVPLAIAIPAMSKARKAFGPSKKDQAVIQQLMTTGAKARATILSVQPTGMIVNHLNIGCQVSFRLDPIDGSASFSANKEMFLNQTQMPRMGDTWPAWYDRNDPTIFAVGQPGPPTPDQLALFAEFGIPHPLAQPGVQPQPAQQPQYQQPQPAPQPQHPTPPPAAAPQYPSPPTSAPQPPPMPPAMPQSAPPQPPGQHPYPPAAPPTGN